LFFVAPKLAKFLRMTMVEPVSLNFFQGIVQSAIKHRVESGEKRNDFIQLMLEAREGQLKQEKPELLSEFEKEAQLSGVDKNGNKLTDFDIFAQCFLFFFAGFDTIESAMVTCCIYLALNPDCQEKLHKELTNELQNPEHGGKLNYDLIQTKLEYMDAFISETQRLYPSAFRTERKAVADYQIPGTKQIVPKGTLLVFPIYSIQNDPDNFENPEKFDPERFLPENKSKMNPYAFLPFGHGPRNCIGMRFALTEVKSMLANLVLNFKVEPSSKTDIPVKYSGATGSLKPSSSLIFKFTSRVK
jgi:cytochrome P450 family 9